MLAEEMITLIVVLLHLLKTAEATFGLHIRVYITAPITTSRLRQYSHHPRDRRTASLETHARR